MSDIVMFLMSVMFLSIAKRIYLMSFGHQYLLVTIYTIVLFASQTPTNINISTFYFKNS